MILRWTLTVIGWCSIAAGPFFAISGYVQTFEFAKLSGETVSGPMLWSTSLGALPGLIIGIGFGAALLMLASLDRRFARPERGAA
ncbi:hypothetical protein [Brevundimonas subvibrioides]|uniref:hypothetical protein n=1 Tax=Brevundimonas subvibrioides TaxID=74313 RepID=UPI0022B528AE|nr:hypothetical protein [Brevundimonas subvibrioides]